MIILRLDITDELELKDKTKIQEYKIDGILIKFSKIIKLFKRELNNVEDETEIKSDNAKKILNCESLKLENESTVI